MRFEFLLSYCYTSSTEIRTTLVEVLTRVLEDNLNEFSVDEIEQMIVLNHQRLGNEGTDDAGNNYQNIILGFTLELPEETNETQTVLDEFAEALLDTILNSHIVKFEDSLLVADLTRWADELFTLEMKLRRVLTLIYLHAYQDSDPYELLKDEKEQPMARDKPERNQMKKAVDNQFFHLTFSQYVNLNTPPEPKIGDLLKKIGNSANYEILCREINRKPIEEEDDVNFLAGLKERMGAIEKMRNCVAHNRRPSRRVVEDYENACPLLNDLLDNYLNQWIWRELGESES
jgi:hypothetical protein